MWVDKPDFLSLNEIKCCEHWANEKLRIRGYNYVYKCRNNHGGGVALLVKEDIIFNEINLEIFPDEIVCIKTMFDKSPFHIISYYNPPNKKLNHEIFNYICMNFRNYILLGDLNAKSVHFKSKKSNNNGEILNSILSNQNCQILNESFEPTFHIYKKSMKDDYHEFLDIIIGSPSASNLTSEYKVIKSNLDSIQPKMFHSMIEISLKIQKNSIDNSTNTVENKPKKKIFLYDNADWANFKSNLELFEIENLESISVNLLNRIISNKIDKKDCIPTASLNNANREPLPLNIFVIEINSKESIKKIDLKRINRYFMKPLSR